MFVPIPILILFGLAFLLLVVQLLRASRRPDPLLGASMAGLDRHPSVARAQSPFMPQPDRTGVPLPPEVETRVRALIAAGRKVEAIKLARDNSHLSLKEAKELV